MLRQEWKTPLAMLSPEAGRHRRAVARLFLVRLRPRRAELRFTEHPDSNTVLFAWPSNAVTMPRKSTPQPEIGPTKFPEDPKKTSMFTP